MLDLEKVEREFGASPAVAGGPDSAHRKIHPDERRQARTSGRAADGCAALRLPGRARGVVRVGRGVHPHGHAHSRRHHRRLADAARAGRGALAVGQRHHGPARRLPLHQVDVAGADAGLARDDPSALRRHAADDRGGAYQLTKNGDVAINEDEHFDIIRRKTAYLFSGSAQIGGMLGNATPERGARSASMGSISASRSS